MSEKQPSKKVEQLAALTKSIIEKQEKERELFGRILLSLAHKEEGPFTIDEWELRSYEILTSAGLKAPALSWAAHRKLKLKKLKEKADAEKV